jgi:3-oxoacyl-[acyl-carrier protein] reductase
MIEHEEGSIINISSIKGIEPTSSPGYGATKAAVIKLTKDFAKPLAKHGIRVNCILPGFIDTGMTSELPPAKKEQYMSQIPIRRFGDPKEIAKVAAFLASEDASYITGSTITVDGGYLMP